MTAQEIITEAKAQGLWGIEVANEYPWLQSGRQCSADCKLDWGQCKQPAYGNESRCYYHGKKERGLIGL